MGSKLNLITHSDISTETKEQWHNDNGQLYYYLKNGFKTSVSTVLIPIGVMGVWDSLTHNPTFTQVFGTNGLIISILAIVIGVLNIWICDRVYEHYLLSKEQKNSEDKKELNHQIHHQEEEIQELSHQLAEQKARILVDEETRKLLEEKLNNLESEHCHQRDHLEEEYTKVIDRFMEDLNK